jgi:hypothetical protein
VVARGRRAGLRHRGVLGTAFGYNWDRPCAFVDDRTFVLALDDDEAASYRYQQLAFFEIPERPSTGHPERLLEPSWFVDCDVFPRNRYGEVKGELHYDPGSGCLVALTEDNGSFVVSVDGDVVARLPDLSYSSPSGWSYAPPHRVFYRWLDGTGIEERAVPA